MIELAQFSIYGGCIIKTSVPYIINKYIIQYIVCMLPHCGFLIMAEPIKKPSVSFDGSRR